MCDFAMKYNQSFTTLSKLSYIKQDQRLDVQD